MLDVLTKMSICIRSKHTIDIISKPDSYILSSRSEMCLIDFGEWWIYQHANLHAFNVYRGTSCVHPLQLLLWSMNILWAKKIPNGISIPPYYKIQYVRNVWHSTYNHAPLTGFENPPTHDDGVWTSAMITLMFHHKVKRTSRTKHFWSKY